MSFWPWLREFQTREEWEAMRREKRKAERVVCGKCGGKREEVPDELK